MAARIAGRARCHVTPPSVQWAMHELHIGTTRHCALYSRSFVHGYMLAVGNERDRRIAEIMIERQGATTVPIEPMALRRRRTDAGNSAARWHLAYRRRQTFHHRRRARLRPENIIHLVSGLGRRACRRWWPAPRSWSSWYPSSISILQLRADWRAQGGLRHQPREENGHQGLHDLGELAFGDVSARQGLARRGATASRRCFHVIEHADAAGEYPAEPLAPAGVAVGDGVGSAGVEAADGGGVDGGVSAGLGVGVAVGGCRCCRRRWGRGRGWRGRPSRLSRRGRRRWLTRKKCHRSGQSERKRGCFIH